MGWKFTAEDVLRSFKSQFINGMLPGVVLNGFYWAESGLVHTGLSFLDYYPRLLSLTSCLHSRTPNLLVRSLLQASRLAHHPVIFNSFRTRLQTAHENTCPERCKDGLVGRAPPWGSAREVWGDFLALRPAWLGKQGKEFNTERRAVAPFDLHLVQNGVKDGDPHMGLT